MPNADRNSPAYRRARAALRRRQDPCWVCGGDIDYDARWPDPLSFTADHVTELDRGGGHDDLAAAHAHCNLSRGARYGNVKRGPLTRPERDW